MLKVRFKASDKGGFTVLFIIVVVLIGILLTGFFKGPTRSKVPLKNANLILTTPSPDPTVKNTLQLRTFGFTTGIPTPTVPFTGKTCAPETEKKDCECLSGSEEYPVCGLSFDECLADKAIWFPSIADRKCMYTPGHLRYEEKLKDPAHCAIYCI